MTLPRDWYGRAAPPGVSALNCSALTPGRVNASALTPARWNCDALTPGNRGSLGEPGTAAHGRFGPSGRVSVVLGCCVAGTGDCAGCGACAGVGVWIELTDDAGDPSVPNNCSGVEVGGLGDPGSLGPVGLP